LRKLRGRDTGKLKSAGASYPYSFTKVDSSTTLGTLNGKDYYEAYAGLRRRYPKGDFVIRSHKGGGLAQATTKQIEAWIARREEQRKQDEKEAPLRPWKVELPVHPPRQVAGQAPRGQGGGQMKNAGVLLPPKQKRKPAETVSFRTPPWVKQRLERTARATGRNLSETVTAILEQAFRMEDALRKPLERTMKAEGLTLAEAVTRLVEKSAKR